MTYVWILVVMLWGGSGVEQHYSRAIEYPSYEECNEAAHKVRQSSDYTTHLSMACVPRPLQPIEKALLPAD